MIGTLASLGTMAYQLYESDQKKKEAGNRPTYQTPEAITEMVGNARTQAAKGLPGADLMRDNVLSGLAGTNNQLQQMGGGAAGMGGILQAYGNSQKQITDIDIMDSQQKMQNQAILRQALGVQGGFQDKEWDYNQRLPYQEAMDDSANLQNAALGNLGNAAGGMDNSLAALAKSNNWGGDTSDFYSALGGGGENNDNAVGDNSIGVNGGSYYNAEGGRMTPNGANPFTGAGVNDASYQKFLEWEKTQGR